MGSVKLAIFLSCTSEQPVSTGAIIGGVTGAVIIILLCCIAVLVFAVVYFRRRKAIKLVSH